MKKNKPIDVDKIDLELMKERTTDLPGLLEYAHSIGGFAITPTEEGVIKSTSLNAMKDQTHMQLQQIYEQMQLLAKQASAIQERAELSLQIYQAEMKFKPCINQVYYLYEKKDGSKLLSLIAPNEWGKSIPFKNFVAKVKMLADSTWQVLKD